MGTLSLYSVFLKLMEHFENEKTVLLHMVILKVLNHEISKNCPQGVLYLYLLNFII